MHARRRFAIPLLLIATTVSAAAAEERQDVDLARLTAVQATISLPTPDSVNCGIDVRALRAELERHLSDGGLMVRDGAEATATLSLMTAHDPDRGVCATGALLGTYRSVAFFDETAGWLRSGQVVLWQRATQVISGRADHATATAATVERLANAMVQSWRTDNAALSAKP